MMPTSRLPTSEFTFLVRCDGSTVEMPPTPVPLSRAPTPHPRMPTPARARTPIPARARTPTPTHPFQPSRSTHGQTHPILIIYKSSKANYEGPDRKYHRAQVAIAKVAPYRCELRACIVSWFALTDSQTSYKYLSGPLYLIMKHIAISCMMKILKHTGR